MSKENCKNESNCKQSFKAVENLLRRIAFNLGNTQSRTEVKIISCIPIDVTDLQQRIFQLQNELADVKASPTKPCTTCTKRQEISPKQLVCNECLVNTTSVVSVFCPGGSSIAQLCRCGSVEGNVSRDCYNNFPKIEEAAKNKSFFARKNKVHKKKVKNRLVYCAQTDTNSPFNNRHRLTNDITPMRGSTSNKGDHLNKSYLADVIRRQYRHRPLGKEFSNVSDISSPVCRDHVPPYSPCVPYFESDVCSCIHGQFENVDKYMNKNVVVNKYQTWETVGKFDKHAYYDSKFYDLIPVKEKIYKNRNDTDNFKRREHKKHVIKCWPEEARPKRCDKHARPTVVNYCTVSPIKDECARFPVYSQNNKHVVMNNMASTRFVSSTPRWPTEVELGPIYTKKVRGHRKKNSATIAMVQHNVGTSSPAADVTGCQTAATAATITDPPEDTTETTLNQIKTMLQSVLIEVKTNGSVGNPPVQRKKDAVVQNDPARSFEYGASQLLQSYTYSPYNMNPFMPSCSLPMSCSDYVYPEYPGVQGVPFQQYPLLIQSPKHLCNNYYRNSNFSKPITKHAASAATNTEHAQERSKETEKLIKEIYKSMALNVEESSKENSFREYTKPNLVIKNHADVVKTESDKESSSIAQAISEIFRNTHPRYSTVTGTTDTTLNSYRDPKKARVESEDAERGEYKTAARNYSRKEHCTKYVGNRETKRMSAHHEAEEQSDDSVIEDTEESSTETETVEEVKVKKESETTAEQKKEKSGFFKKILKMFHQKRRRRQRNDVASQNGKESDSDSDDYQTVYSHKVVDATPKPKKVAAVRSRPHSKVFYSKQPQNGRSRTRSPEKHARTPPYMEQEYRRYWDEELMFHENQRQQRCTGASRQPPHREQRNKPAYYHNYVARPVLVDPSRQVPLRMPFNVSQPRYTASKSHFARYSENYIGTRPNNPGYDYQSNPNNIKHKMNAGPAGPHFLTVKSNATRKSTFAKGWLKKCKPECAQQWKDLILNG